MSESRPSESRKEPAWTWLVAVLLAALFLLAPALTPPSHADGPDTPGATNSALAHAGGASGTTPVVRPNLQQIHGFLNQLSERDKSKALNILADLAAESRLDKNDIDRVLAELVGKGSPPEDFGYQSPSCFQRRLSGLLAPLRLLGPRVKPPAEGLLVLRLNDRFLRRLTSEALAEVGGELTGLVEALLAGYDLTGKFRKDTWARYHGRNSDPRTEPAFFHSASGLAEFEAELNKPLDAWSLSRWSCERPPSNRFEAGFIILHFRPPLTCADVHIPTAADTEDPYFRPTPLSERRSGVSCGGAREWVCPNIRLFEVTKSRYVPNESYLK